MIEAVHKIIDALKASPLLLALLAGYVIIVVMLALLLREISAATKADRTVRNQLLLECMQQNRGK